MAPAPARGNSLDAPFGPAQRQGPGSRGRTEHDPAAGQPGEAVNRNGTWAVSPSVSAGRAGQSVLHT